MRGEISGHRQGKMLDRLKTIKNLADESDNSTQMQALQQFISLEL